MNPSRKIKSFLLFFFGLLLRVSVHISKSIDFQVIYFFKRKNTYICNIARRMIISHSLLVRNTSPTHSNSNRIRMRLFRSIQHRSWQYCELAETHQRIAQSERTSENEMNSVEKEK